MRSSIPGILAVTLALTLGATKSEPTPASTATPDGSCICPPESSNKEKEAFPKAVSSTPEFFNQPPWTSATSVNRMHSMMIGGMPCFCSLALHRMPIRDDYSYTPVVGSHKLHTRALTWNEARKVCNDEGSHLAIVNSIAEAEVLKKLFNSTGLIKGAPYQDVALVGIHDLYKEGEWVTVLGVPLAKTGYTKWTNKWGGQPDNGGGRQNCGVILTDGELDDVSCEVPFAFFCEQPAVQFFF